MMLNAAAGSSLGYDTGNYVKSAAASIPSPDDQRGPGVLAPRGTMQWPMQHWLNPARAYVERSGSSSGLWPQRLSMRAWEAKIT